MTDANALTLLPPRPTAQAPKDANKDKSSDPAIHATFKHKLAKKLNAVAAVKVQIAPGKPPALKKATPMEVKPVAEEVRPVAEEVKPQVKAQLTPEKTLTVKTAAPVVEVEKKVKSPKPAKTEAQEAPKPAHTSSLKKPSLEMKPQVDEQPAIAPKKPAVEHKAVAKPTAEPPAQLLHVPANAVLTAPTPSVADVSDSDSTDPVAPKSGTFYGSGKIATAGSLDKSGQASGFGSADGSAGINAAANAAAAVVDPNLTPIAVPLTEVPDAGGKPVSSADRASGAASDLLGVSTSLPTKAAPPFATKATAGSVPSQSQFVETNQTKIVSSIQGQLMPHGGTLQIRLDPPELGALQVTVHMRDGVMTASFETSSDHATKLLSHSLGQLKSGLEAAGMSVEKLHVEQAPSRDSRGEFESDSKQPPQQQQQEQAQQDQQRREMVQRMWRKLAGGGDPLDLVA